MTLLPRPRLKTVSIFKGFAGTEYRLRARLPMAANRAMSGLSISFFGRYLWLSTRHVLYSWLLVSVGRWRASADFNQNNGRGVKISLPCTVAKLTGACQVDLVQPVRIRR